MGLRTGSNIRVLGGGKGVAYNNAESQVGYLKSRPFGSNTDSFGIVWAKANLGQMMPQSTALVPYVGHNPALMLPANNAHLNMLPNVVDEILMLPEKVPSNLRGNNPLLVSEGVGEPKLNYKSGYDKHLIEVEGVVRKKNKGIVGGHDLEKFEEVFKSNGWNIGDCIIGRPKAHPTIDGIYEIEYRIPALNKKGEIIEGEFKNIPNPKTVFDPSKISNEEILKWGKRAMEEGLESDRIINGREIEGYAKNGLKFKGYIDQVTGEITNFFPTLN